MKRETPLQCSWPAPVSIDGLSAENQARIQQIGFVAWMEEIATGKKFSEASAEETKTLKRRTRRPCVRCGNSFLAKRTDARFCSGKCRIRASRGKNGLTETDKNFRSLQTTEA